MCVVVFQPVVESANYRTFDFSNSQVVALQCDVMGLCHLLHDKKRFSTFPFSVRLENDFVLVKMVVFFFFLIRLK